MQKQSEQGTFLGVDLGGTKLLVGEMDASGRLLGYKKYPSGPLTQSAALKLMEACVDDYLASSRPPHMPAPLAMGMGLVGRIDSRRGMWMSIDSQRTEVIPAAQILSKRYNIPCFLDNDVRSATRAELLFGRGCQSRDMIYINIGTGIAAGIVSGGQLIFGSHCNAGEVGHAASGISLQVGCACGRMDCVETIASGFGFDKCARVLAAEFPGTKLHIPQNGTKISVREVFSLYEEDILCRRLTDNAAQSLANLIMNLVRVSDPDTVVLGGGVMSDGFLYPKVLDCLNQYTVRFVTNGIVLTQLDPAFVGLMGACSNAIQGREESV